MTDYTIFCEAPPPVRLSTSDVSTDTLHLFLKQIQEEINKRNGSVQ